MPATMPNIAIKPLKRSAPVFMIEILKQHPKHSYKLFESGIPNGLTDDKNSK